MARGMHAEIVAVFGLDVPVDLSLGFAPISAAMYQPEWRATLKTNAGGRVDRPTQGVRVAPTGDESGSGRRTPSEPEEEEEPAAWSHKFGGLYGGLSQWKALGYPRGVTDADPIAVAPTPRPRPLDANQPTTTSPQQPVVGAGSTSLPKSAQTNLPSLPSLVQLRNAIVSER